MTPNPTPPASATPASSRGAQLALVVFVAVLVGLLAFRAYGGKVGARPTEAVHHTLIDLNTADQSELAQVPGVGPKTAEAIIDHRRVFGNFKTADELRNVRGIGPVTYEKIRNYFRVSRGSVATNDDGENTYPSPTPQLPVNQFVQPQQPQPAPKPSPANVRKIQPGDPPINVNTATAEELQRLPSVGPVTAQNILAARALAPFRSVDDLDKVKGIGAKTLDKLRPFVVVK